MFSTYQMHNIYLPEIKISNKLEQNFPLQDPKTQQQFLITVQNTYTYVRKTTNTFFLTRN